MIWLGLLFLIGVLVYAKSIKGQLWGQLIGTITILTLGGIVADAMYTPMQTKTTVEDFKASDVVYRIGNNSHLYVSKGTTGKQVDYTDKDYEDVIFDNVKTTQMVTKHVSRKTTTLHKILYFSNVANPHVKNTRILVVNPDHFIIDRTTLDHSNRLKQDQAKRNKNTDTKTVTSRGDKVKLNPMDFN